MSDVSAAGARVPDGAGRTETLLRAAAAGATWPARPELARAVGLRIGRLAEAELAPRRRFAQRQAAPRSFRLGRAIALAIAALLVLAGIAAALGYGLPGLRIEFTGRPPAGPPAGSGLALGTPVPLGDARSLGVPTVLVPGGRFAAPDGVYRSGEGDSTIVTLVYRAAAGEGHLAGSDLSVVVMAVPGDTEQTLITKFVGPGTTVDPVTIGGSRGWWIAGAPHELLIKRPNGDVAVQQAVIAGDTLLFSRGGTLYRIESALGQDATVALAETMR